MLLFLAAFFLSEQNVIFYKAGDAYLSDCTTLLPEGSWENCSPGQIATGTSVKTCCFRDSKNRVADSAL